MRQKLWIAAGAKGRAGQQHLHLLLPKRSWLWDALSVTSSQFKSRKQVRDLRWMKEPSCAWTIIRYSSVHLLTYTCFLIFTFDPTNPTRVI
ncbi:hypothetical protein Q5P01_011285 [Channa striata]|uniref:Uncharacterized protein n=1 Tax=Channa striata TaxID=64152 RepID=A0AA88MT00_CHASR|nr:hypothetical protein Q5P01_011285 [Channa striata]